MDKLETLYSELVARGKVLQREKSENTDSFITLSDSEIDGKISENKLCIIRVQQLILENINK